MLECPFCGQPLDQEILNNWFQCVNCANWYRLRRNPNNQRWLERGMERDSEIQPVRSPNQGGQTMRTSSPSTSNPNSPPRRTLPNVDDMDPAAVRAQRQQVTNRLRDRETNIQNVISLQARSIQDQDRRLAAQYNTQLSQLTQEQNELRQFEERLNRREIILLQQELETARQPAGPNGSGSGAIFIGSTILTAISIFVFTRMINLHIDPRAILVLLGIALAAGFLTWILGLANS